MHNSSLKEFIIYDKIEDMKNINLNNPKNINNYLEAIIAIKTIEFLKDLQSKNSEIKKTNFYCYMNYIS